MNNASKNVVNTFLFDGLKANYSQIIFSPELMSAYSPIVVEELFRLVDIRKMTGYTLNLFLEQANETGFLILDTLQGANI